MNANLYAKVEEASAEYRRLAARSGGDWARDGYGIEAAQKAVETARKAYLDAVKEYGESMEK